MRKVGRCFDMANWTFPIDTGKNIYPNLTVHQKLRDNEFKGWRVVPASGDYVMYDTTATDTTPKYDEETGTWVETPIIYYFTRVDSPPNFNFANFTWAAELRSNVPDPDNQIFGGGDNSNSYEK